MTRVLFIGRAELVSETFEFKIGEWCGGIGLMMRHTGYGKPVETGAGIWPTVDKAKQIADQTVRRLLGPTCSIAWTEIEGSEPDQSRL